MRVPAGHAPGDRAPRDHAVPGVTVSGDTVDAAGRPGIGITFEERGSAIRNEWILDRTSLAFLGDGAYFTGHHGGPDVLFHTSAVLGRTVTDGVGRPAAGKDPLTA
ncbi:hypothetical protein [Streptomyces sp. NPDC059861]|uniref:hypothetical protein n=1 Tax=Streptomyces sp. NPDC059861 TaxID=3346974 RepID=UPI003650397B